MKKTYLVALTALTMSSLFADEMSKKNGQMKDKGQMPQSGGGMMMTTAYDNMGPKLASARPNIDGHGWYMFGDFLWWHAQEGGTDWAYRVNDSDLPGVLEYKNHRVNFGWDPGFRVGIGWNMKHDEWDTNFYYTWFQTTRKSTIGISSDDALVQTTFPLIAPGVESADASNEWNIHFSMFDWELGRNYFVSPKLSLRPHMGIKGGWIHQNVKDEFQIIPNGAEWPVATNMHNYRKNNMWAVGPSAGVNTKWFFASHENHDFSLFGDFAGALMWGHFNGEDHVRFTHSVTLDDDDILSDLHVHGLDMNRSVPMLQAMFGWVWDTNFNKDRCHFSLRLAWEVQYWFSANQMANNTNDIEIDSDDNAILDYNRTSEDLIFQGGTFGIRFDF